MSTRQKWWQLLPLIYCLLVSLCSIVSAASHDGSIETPPNQATYHNEQAPSAHNEQGWAEGSDGHEHGFELFQEAQGILKDQSRHGKAFRRRERPTGFLGKAEYYTKEILVFLFMNGPSSDAPSSHSSRDTSVSKALGILEAAAHAGSRDAMYTLAEIRFYGLYNTPRKYHDAFRIYEQLTQQYGNSTAQNMVGFMYATGFGGVVARDQAKALLYHTFAAEADDLRSQMTVAYRHHTGIGTPRNCDEASHYYKLVADKAIDAFRSGPLGGAWLPRDSYRLADEEGGVYGAGASVVSAGENAVHGSPSSDIHADFDDVLEYLDLLSRKGELKATFRLGILYYEGSRPMRRDLKVARKYFMSIAKKYWATQNGKPLQGASASLEKLASKAAGYLGMMFVRGEETEQNFEKAKLWFRRGVSNGDALSQYFLGLMYLRGLGFPKDAVKATSYLKSAAEQDSAPAQTALGALFLDQGDVVVATQYFEIAARHGNLEAFYYLAEITNQGLGRERSCGMATAYYKLVAERAEIVHSSFAEANDAYERGDLETALVRYMMAGEQGYEVGQSNVAYLLDREKSKLQLTSLLPKKSRGDTTFQNPALALIYWTRSAKQSNVDSLVKMGDYYLNGIGAPEDNEKAATCYQAAAEFQQSAQALWNLGWMHENGVGVNQDFHLAKRFYDMSLETNHEAYLPVSLALLKLRARSFWNTITHGRINSIQEEPEPKKEWSFREWINNFLQADAEYYYDDVEYDDDTTDPTRNTLPGDDGFYDEVDDGLLESFLIVGLAAALAFLVYYRQQRQINQRQAAQNNEHQARQGQGDQAAQANGAAVNGQGADQQQQPGAAADRGLFPQPGDPDFAQWVAGGALH